MLQKYFPICLSFYGSLFHFVLPINWVLPFISVFLLFWSQPKTDYLHQPVVLVWFHALWARTLTLELPFCQSSQHLCLNGVSHLDLGCHLYLICCVAKMTLLNSVRFL